jgi:endo-1,4-beta-D-glucanase Y
MFSLFCSPLKLAQVLPLSLTMAVLSCSEVTICGCPGLQAAEPETAAPLALPNDFPSEDLFIESWQAYRGRFIQTDGRVIDRENRDRTVSEGQAYAMLRAVAINDPETFLSTFTWAENNLVRVDAEGNQTDQLWAWKWGQKETGEWTIIDPNFASDADIDAITALILAAYRWNCPEYLDIARTKLADLWQYSTVELPDGSRQLLPGPAAAFWSEPETLILNPSYFAPASFRLFAQVDPDHDWSSLVESGYTMLEQSSAISPAGLPADWIAYNPETETYSSVPADSGLQSNYSFDAYRVWWRVAMDAAWYNAPRAEAYLTQHLDSLIQQWDKDRSIPARLSLQGEPLSYYEATSQYGMLYPALEIVDVATGQEIYLQKIQSVYQDGFWDSNTAYYTQNLVWMGLLLNELSPKLFEHHGEACPPLEVTAPEGQPPA